MIFHRQTSLVVDGRRVALETGRGGLKKGRPTLVLVHGSGGSARAWSCQVNPLDHWFNVAALDLPGHGNSAGPCKDRIEDYAAWLIRTLKALDPPNRPFLVGASMGAAVAIDAVLTEPECFQGLILIGAGARLYVEPGLISALRLNDREALRIFNESLFAPGADRMLVDRSYEILAMTDPEVLERDLSACAGFDRRDRIGSIRRPVLVLCGAQDRLTPPELTRTLAEAMPMARCLVIGRSGHLVMIEQHRAVNSAVKDFIDQWPPLSE